MNIRDLLNRIQTEFFEAGIAHPEVDAELLVGHVLAESRGRVQALAILGSHLTEEQASRVLSLAAERATRVPLQHLTGVAPFRGLELQVGPGVFVPRPETETVAQHALESLTKISAPRVIDLCTGSGALALAIASEISNASVWAWEKSTEAHAWAKRNVATHGKGRVQLIHGDILELLNDTLRAKHPEMRPHSFDLIVSNPPYVPSGMVPRDPEVRDHDPEMALYSGSDGLDLIRSISKIGLLLGRPGVSIVLEHAELQGAAIREILENDGWLNARTHQDLTLRDRCTTAISPLTDTHH